MFSHAVDNNGRFEEFNIANMHNGVYSQNINLIYYT